MWIFLVVFFLIRVVVVVVSCCLDSRRIKIGVSRPNRLTIGVVTRFDNSSITLYGVVFFLPGGFIVLVPYLAIFFSPWCSPCVLDYFLFGVYYTNLFLIYRIFFPLLLCVRAYLYPLL
jgi:hypothetical protein